MSNETRTLMQAVQIDRQCECGGFMRPTGMCLTSNPPQYPHLCNKCGAAETFYSRTYPRIGYEEIKP